MVKEREYKILFGGPFGSGKTTAIEAISDIGVVRTDAEASDVVSRIKPTTTVALDYGLIELEGGARVHLYGLPGQERFDFMWEILSRGALGMVLLIDNHRPFPLRDLSFFLKQFAPFLERRAMVVGVTKYDLKQDPSLEEYRLFCDRERLHLPVVEVDARSREDIRLLLQTLLYVMDPTLGRKVADG